MSGGHDSHGDDHGGHDDHGHGHGPSKGQQTLDDFLADVHPDKLRDISGKHEEAHNFAYQKVAPSFEKIDYDKVKDDELLDLIAEYIIHHDYKRELVHADHLDPSKRSDEFKFQYREKVKQFISGKSGDYKSGLENIRREKGISSTIHSVKESLKGLRMQQHISNAHEKHIDNLRNEEDGTTHMIDLAKAYQKLDTNYADEKISNLVNLVSDKKSMIEYSIKKYQNHNFN